MQNEYHSSLQSPCKDISNLSNRVNQQSTEAVFALLMNSPEAFCNRRQFTIFRQGTESWRLPDAISSYMDPALCGCLNREHVLFQRLYLHYLFGSCIAGLYLYQSCELCAISITSPLDYFTFTRISQPCWRALVLSVWLFCLSCDGIIIAITSEQKQIRSPIIIGYSNIFRRICIGSINERLRKWLYVRALGLSGIESRCFCKYLTRNCVL